MPTPYIRYSKGLKRVVPFVVSEFQALKFVHFVSLRETANFSFDRRAAPPSLAGHSGDKGGRKTTRCASSLAGHLGALPK